MRISTAILSTLLVLTALATPLGAQQSGNTTQGLPEFPALTGRVIDEADILSTSARSELAEKLAALEAKSTDQLVVVTLANLRGQTIEEYGVALGRHWRIGQAIKNNGVMLLVAPNQRKVRIEVGYGLEGVLTDAVTKLIIENSILPRFRTNEMPRGIVRGVDDIIDILTGDPEEWKRRAQPVPAVGHSVWRDFGETALTLVAVLAFGSIFAVFFVALGLIFVTLLVKFAAWIGILPRRQNRTGFWRWVNAFDPDPGPRHIGRHSGSSGSSRSSSDWSSSSDSSSSSSSSNSSGGGGDFGGGGSSGSW
jgi:uncharacterized protein